MCTDCYGTQKQLQEGFAIAQGKAKELAVKTGENVFIFQTPEGWQFMVESVARAQGIYPSGGVVSGLIPAA